MAGRGNAGWIDNLHAAGRAAPTGDAGTVSQGQLPRGATVEHGRAIGAIWRHLADGQLWAPADSGARGASRLGRGDILI